MNSSDTFKLALLQHEPTPCDKAASIRRIEKYLIASAEQESDLLLVPEASLTGYNISVQEAQSIATERDSDTTEELQKPLPRAFNGTGLPASSSGTEMISTILCRSSTPTVNA